MSTRYLNHAFALVGISSSQKFVLVALADAADDIGECFPSIAHIEAKTNLDRKTVINAIAELSTRGILEDTGNRRGRTKQVKVLRLTIPNNPEIGTVIKESQISEETVPFFPSKSTVFPSKESQKRDTEPSLTTKEPPVTAKASAREKNPDDGFEEFWKVYPRRIAKLAAQRAYRAALKKTLAANIVAAAKLYADSVNGTDDRYVKHPATWLNGGCWLDFAHHQYAAEAKSFRLAPEVISTLRKHPTFTDTAIGRWLDPCTVTPPLIVAPSSFHAEWIEKNFSSALDAVFGQHMEIVAAKPSQMEAQ